MDDTSPENLQKFLDSDDPALRLMGLSMAKGSRVPETFYTRVFMMSLWESEEENRRVARELVEKIGLENMVEESVQYIESWNEELFENNLFGLIKENLPDNFNVDIDNFISVEALEAMECGDDMEYARKRVLELHMIKNDEIDGYILREVEEADCIDDYLVYIGDDLKDYASGYISAVKPSYNMYIETAGHTGDLRVLNILVNVMEGMIMRGIFSGLYKSRETLFGTLSENYPIMEKLIECGYVDNWLGEGNEVHDELDFWNRYRYIPQGEDYTTSFKSKNESGEVIGFSSTTIDSNFCDSTVLTAIKAIGQLGHKDGIKPLLKFLKVLEKEEKSYPENFEGSDEWKAKESVISSLKKLGYK